MKTNHEMLKEICDTIGYSLLQNGFDIDTNTLIGGGGINKIISKSQSVGQRDEREIIFTQEFMDKYWDYFKEKQNGIFDIRNNICDFITVNLDNPILYLYNTLGLGQKKENN